MNQLKKYLGLLWILIGPAAVVFMTWHAIEKIHVAYGIENGLQDAAAKALAHGAAVNTLLQWIIIILVFLPVAAGMVIFGKYALQGEYDELPTNSERLY